MEYEFENNETAKKLQFHFRNECFDVDFVYNKKLFNWAFGFHIDIDGIMFGFGPFSFELIRF